MRLVNRWKKVQAVFILSAATMAAAHAQGFKSLADFEMPGGANPLYESLVQGRDGNLYGTTFLGGDLTCNLGHGCGTIFRITPTGALTTLHSFEGADGSSPWGGLVLGADGSFYGTTKAGGGNEVGTVFKITPNGKLTALHNFDGTDGHAPVAGLVQATDGEFYGTTSGGGKYTVGTVFKITPNGVLTTLHYFNQDTDGSSPEGALLEGTDGSLYGTTYYGGVFNEYPCDSGCGTIFRITRDGAYTTVYKFCVQGDCLDGYFPYAGLMQASDGNFYGTTLQGGLHGQGTVFKITPKGALTTLYTFAGTYDGIDPYAGIVQATDGNFYGTTSGGGPPPAEGGTVFMMTPQGVLTTMHGFNGNDGFDAIGGLLQATNGFVYGMTANGGDLTCRDDGGDGCGTAFSVDMGLGPFVAFVRAAGKVGQTGGILGQGFTGTTSVSLNGTPANFTVVSDTFISATVPAGASTGYVMVTTPSGVLTSNVPFHVIQ